MKSSRSIASASSALAWALAALVVAVIVAWPGQAHARKRLVVLEFSGPKADDFQADLQKHLKKRHSVVPTAKWDNAADDLGATKLSAANIKRVAAELHLDGVIAGKVEKRGSRYYAHLTLYAGATGKSVKKVDLVERSPGLGPDGKGDIDEQLLPFVDDLTAPGFADAEDEDTEDEDAEPAPPKSKGKGKGKAVSKARDDDEDEDDDEDDSGRTGWGRTSRAGAADDEDEDRSARGKSKAKGKAKTKGKSRGDEDEDAEDEDRSARGKSKAKGKSRGDEDEDAEDEDDDEDDRDGDDRRRVASRDDRDRGDDGDDGEDDRDAGDQDTAAAGGPAAVDVSAGLSFTGRKLGFTTNLAANAPQGYDGAPVPGIRISADVFPLAMNKRNKSFTRNLGVTALFDRAIKISSQLATAGMTYTLPTTEQHLAIGVVYRHPLSAVLTVEGSLRYNKRKFAIDKAGVPADAVDIPNTDYTYVDPGLGVGYRLGPKMVLGADLRFLLITNTGEMQSPDQYGASTVTGVDAAASFDYQVAPKVVVRVGVGLATIGYAFKGNGALTNNRDGNAATIDVSGARDTYFGGSAGAAYQF
ncbi:MAG: hypothetical protein R3B06_21660 [Kofleriaceae bacterium]